MFAIPNRSHTGRVARYEESPVEDKANVGEKKHTTINESDANKGGKGVITSGFDPGMEGGIRCQEQSVNVWPGKLWPRIVGKTYLGEIIILPLSECIGISFDIFGANLRETIEGQVTIVSKSSHSWADFCPWFVLANLYVLLSYSLWHIIGPLSSITLTIIFILVGARKGTVPESFILSCICCAFWLNVYFGLGLLTFFIIAGYYQQGEPRSPHPSFPTFKSPGKLNLSHTFKSPGKLFLSPVLGRHPSFTLKLPQSPPTFSLGGTYGDSIRPTTPSSSPVLFSLSSSSSSSSVTSRVAHISKRPMTDSQESPITTDPTHSVEHNLTRETAYPSTANGLVRLASQAPRSTRSFALPQRAQMSYVFEFSQEQMIHLLELRKSIVAGRYKYLVCNSWISNRYVEYLMSLFLPDFIYNNRSIRRMLQLISDFIVPIFAIVQGLSILFPWIGGNLVTFWQLAKEDIGSGFLLSIVRTIVSTIMNFISGSTIVKLFGGLVGRIVELMVSTIFESEVVEQISKLINFCQYWILRLHYFAVYLGSQLPIRIIVDTAMSLFTFFSKTFQFAVIKPIYFFFRLVSNLAAVFRFGRRTPEHIVMLIRRIGETCRLVWDRYRAWRLNKRGRAAPLTPCNS